MYSIYAVKDEQSICIYNDMYGNEGTTAINPKLTLTESNAGEFTIKIPVTNVGYEFIERLTTEIIIKKSNKEIWSGRVISTSEDFFKNKTLTCEGELAYLNDTTQPQAEYHDLTPRDFLSTLLFIHDIKADNKKQFLTGYVTVTDPNDSLYRYTNYESTLEDINDKLIERLGGFIRVRKEDGERYLDYISEDTRPTSSQVVKFGSNLLDFTKSYDSTEFCTVVLPLGAILENEDGSSSSEIEALEEYLTVESVNEGSPYVVNEEAVETFGWIEKVVRWDNVHDPDILLRKAIQYLREVQYDNMVLEAKAVDLQMLDVNAEAINLSDRVRVVSNPHGLDRFFSVTKITIPLDNPGNTSFTMGSVVNQSLSSKSVSGNYQIMEKINNMPTKSEILNTAKANATDIINSFTTGYITTTQSQNGSNELYITDVKISDGYDPEDPAREATRYWRWNLNGLGYFNRDNITPENPSGMKLAMTMDGSIVADFITTGSLSCDRLNGGVIRGQHIYGSYIEGSEIKGSLIYRGSSTLRSNENYIILDDFHIQVHAPSQEAWIRCMSGNEESYVPSTDRVYFQKEFGISSENCHVRRSGTEYVTDAYNIIMAAKYWEEHYSDVELKKDIKKLSPEDSLKILDASDIYSFKFNGELENIDSTKTHYGVIAQNVIEKCGKDLEETSLIEKEYTGYYHVDYSQYIPHLINVVRYLNDKVEKLEHILNIEKGESDG